MSQPPNPYAGGMPGKRTPEMPPNPYHGGHPGQRSPWGHSSPRHFNQYSNSRQHSQSMPSNQWGYSPHHSGGSPHFTPPHKPSYSPIPMQPFSTPYSNNRGQRGRPSMGAGNTPYGDKRQGQKTFHKDRRFSGGGGGRGGHKRGSDAPIERYVKDDMLQNPWAELERREGNPPAAT
ncbi:uncharacterized protein [Apostichopus japonicus]|uniref:uncharacterized protein n=1 Tax=Stichopus japonicus TaxID=307972 RepID=UPI003AB2FDAA